jgi:hypothetical protein
LFCSGRPNLSYLTQFSRCNLFPSRTIFFQEHKIGAGGMADTRDPAPMKHEDPRKSISVAPSFEEYMKQRAAEAAKGK